MAQPSIPYTFRDLDADMQAVRSHLAVMAARCRGQMDLALDAFWTGSKEKAAGVEASDDAVDADEKSIDALALRVIALRQPVASDLRTLTALFKVVTDLERIGDEAVDLARGVAPLSQDAEPIRACLRRMAELAETMFFSAVSSFLDRDVRAAEQVSQVNGVVGMLYREIIGRATTFMTDHPADMVPAMAAMNAAKCLRRIAEHAKNVAEETLFVVRGEPIPR
jgi:phosphate transport system protein